MPNFVKAIVMTLVTFFSIHYLTANLTMALALALIPLILGLMGIMQGLAYSFAALCLIGAVAWSIAPNETRGKVRAEIEKTGFTLTAR